MRGASFLAAVTLGAAVLVAAGGCTTPQPQPTTYFTQTIDPILQSSCVRTNTGVGCHVADAKGNAFGNLDLATYDGVNRRRDLLLDYGPYLQPSLLVKNVASYAIQVQLWNGTKIDVTTDIKHTGGAILDPTASAYQILRRWIENGATQDNTGVAPQNLPRTPCSHLIPTADQFSGAAGFVPGKLPPPGDWSAFQMDAEPVLAGTCAAGNCHGSLVNAMYLTCGSTQDEALWNYFVASQYAAPTAEQSELLRRPLATSQGGSYHEGGALYASVKDVSYVAIEKWLTTHGPPATETLDPAFQFFADMVQPVLVKKGCMMAQCHSAGMFHDYRLRGGSGGSFSENTTRRNYDFTVAQMSFESDDVSASRLVRKNLYRPVLQPGSPGLAHRGGPLLEDFGAQSPSGALCDQGMYTYDPAHVDGIPAFCVIYQWHKMERTERKLGAPTAVVYVSRPVPSGSDRFQDFDVFAGGASLHIVQVTPQAGGGLTAGADAAVDLSACGLGASPDIRRPAVSWDGLTIAFAARGTASDPLAIYTVDAATGANCKKQTDIASHPVMSNGLLVHDFDPAFSPPGPDGSERIVFASTRGNLDGTGFDYSGATRTPSDPTKPNANLYAWDMTSSGANHVRQLTWQLNTERLPSFMQDGRLVFTSEKREPDFYELALRRQNLDGSDYHPLYAQRGSIGYPQATYVSELSYKDFAAVFSDTGAQHGAGALGVFNRSIGVDFTSANKADYLVDPTVLKPGSASSVESDFFLHSLTVLASDGSYTSPAPLPDGQILVSFGSGAPDSFGGDYDLYVFDPATGTKTRLLGTAGTEEIEAAAVYARAPKGIFVPVGDEPNGNTGILTSTTNAEVKVLDMPVLASLLFQNTPTGRVVERDLPSFEIWEDLPPDVTSMPACGGNTACDNLGPQGKVYTRRRSLGTVPVLADGSARFQVPGGMPIVLHLADDSESKAMGLPRWQREEMTFLPGEVAHQSFRAQFFDNLCGNCHGAVSGKPFDVALNPDFLTQASAVQATSVQPTPLTEGPGQRGSVHGPPFTP